jgi:hypothetical protein
MDQSWELERAIVWLLAREADKRKMKQAEFARLAFKGYANPESTWSQVRTGIGDGKYRRLQFTEMVRLAGVLGEDIQQLIFRGRSMLADGWTNETADNPIQ